MTHLPRHPGREWRWIVRATAVVALLMVGWVGLTSWDAVVGGHPLYGVLLAGTVVGAGLAGWRGLRDGRPPTGWRRVIRVVLLSLALGLVALLAWLRPMGAVEPAISALQSDGKVQVFESPTRIVLSPTTSVSSRGVFFQPGARVDARAYAAILRPLAEAGQLW